MINIIVKIKNPNNIFEYCQKNNIYLDLLKDINSHFWMKLLETYYSRYINLKNQALSIKDYYVLLYYCELFTLLDEVKLIEKSQELLLKLPQIYQGDHIAIIHACNNIAIRMGIADVVMTRNTKEDLIYGLGYLVIYYLNNNGRDIFIDKYIEQYKYIKGVDPLRGGNYCK